MGDEKRKGEIAEQLGKVRWRAAWRDEGNSEGPQALEQQQQRQRAQTAAAKAARAAAEAAADASAAVRRERTTAEDLGGSDRSRSGIPPLAPEPGRRPSFGFGGGGGVGLQDVLLGSAESRYQSAMSAIRHASDGAASDSPRDPPSYASSHSSSPAVAAAVAAAQRAAEAVAAAAQAAALDAAARQRPYSGQHWTHEAAAAAEAGHFAAASVAAAAAAAAASVAAAVTGERRRRAAPFSSRGASFPGASPGRGAGLAAADEVAADLGAVFHATAKASPPAALRSRPVSPARFADHDGLSPTSSGASQAHGGGSGSGGSPGGRGSPTEVVGLVVGRSSPRPRPPWAEDDVALRQEAWEGVLAQQQAQSARWQATLARQAELSQYWEEQLRNQVSFCFRLERERWLSKPHHVSEYSCSICARGRYEHPLLPRIPPPPLNPVLAPRRT